MQYTKSMIDQIFLIRKIVPDRARAQVKLTNPDLLDLLLNVYREVEDLLLRDLIRQLMAMAGPAWISRLQSNQEQHKSPQDHSHQMYRGCARITTPPPFAKTSTTAKAKEKTVIYRGHVVALSS
jgi:hypothetical protein